MNRRNQHPKEITIDQREVDRNQDLPVVDPVIGKFFGNDSEIEVRQQFIIRKNN